MGFVGILLCGICGKYILCGFFGEIILCGICGKYYYVGFVGYSLIYI
jgi:transcription elongation factor Elf1